MRTIITNEINQNLNRLNQGLKNSFNCSQEILANIDDGITLVGLNGEILDCNKASLEILNLSREEFIGKNVYDMIIDEDRQRAIDGAIQVLEKGRIVNQVRVKRKNKPSFWAEISVTVLYDSDKKPVAFLGVTRDISERKKTQIELENSKEKLENIINATDDGIVLLGLDGKVQDCNQATLNQLGIGKEELIGKAITDYFVAENKQEIIEEIQAQVRTTGKARTEASVKGNKAIFAAEIVLTTFLDKNKKPIGLIGVARDITKRKKTEKELELYRDHLERLVEEKTAQLKKTERLATIGETAGMVGHDIRNPLQAIAGDLYLIDNDTASLPDNETKKSLHESVNSIQANLLYIAKIVEDLQDYAKEQKPKLEKVEINKVIEEVMKLIIIPHNQEVKIDIPQCFPQIVTDFSMLKRALSNLVNNAVQAMPNGGQLAVRAYCKDIRVFISVEDTGEGVPDEIKPKLFEPMFTTKAKGQGLGLAVVKRFVEALGGTIRFESEKGKGTKFIIDLPINR